MAKFWSVILLSINCRFFLSFSSQISPTDPDYVFEVEKTMAAIIRSHIENDISDFADLLKYVVDLEQRSQKHENADYTDPITSFKQVKSLINEWKQIRKMIHKSSTIESTSQKSKDGRLPHKKDLDEIVQSLFRIQDTYRFGTKEIADGKIAGMKPAGKLSASDCYDIGMVAYSKSDYYHSLMWLQEAGSRLENEDTPTVKDIDVLAPLAISLDETGNKKHAIRAAVWLSDLLDNMSRDDKISILRKYSKIEKLINDGRLMKTQLYQENLPPPENERNVKSPVLHATFETLCRGDLPQVSYSKPFSKCYLEKDNPFLKMTPVKAELLHENPLIILYHDVITDNENEFLRQMVKGNLKRAQVGTHTADTSSYVSTERTSSTAWLHNSDHEIIIHLQKRVGTVTGFDMKFAESLQMCFYGFGEHYLSHYDFSKERRGRKYWNGTTEVLGGERIATWMYYLTEPKRGGATVFPYLKLTVPPKKNAALFWYNLNRSGAGIEETLHGGCPVISGVKWVSNQWINERGQEFLKPCGIEDES